MGASDVVSFVDAPPHPPPPSLLLPPPPRSLLFRSSTFLHCPQLCPGVGAVFIYYCCRGSFFLWARRLFPFDCGTSRAETCDDQSVFTMLAPPVNLETCRAYT